MALALDFLRSTLSRWINKYAWLPVISIYVLLAWTCISFAESHYYKPDRLRIQAGKIISANTPEDSLIIAAPDIPGTDCRDPRLLFRSRRNGWSIYKRELTPELIDQLRMLGAEYLAIVTKHDNAGKMFGFEAKEFKLDKTTW